MQSWGHTVQKRIGEGGRGGGDNKKEGESRRGKARRK